VVASSSLSLCGWRRGTKEFREYGFLQTPYGIDQGTHPVDQATVAIDESSSLVLEASRHDVLKTTVEATEQPATWKGQAKSGHPQNRFDIRDGRK
jgi:hypothetical protein